MSLFEHLKRGTTGTLAALLILTGILACSPAAQEPVADADLTSVTLSVENMT